MTKEELIKLSRENLRKSKQGSLCECYDEAFIKGYQLSEKRIAELEKENKVLAQNLEDTEIINKTYEKRFDDLEKENAELRNNGFTVSAMTEQLLKVAFEKGEQLEKENAELKTKVTALENANRAMVKELDDTTSGRLNILQNVVKNKEELATAKEIISEYINILKGDTKNWKKTQEKAEQFLKDCEVK